MPRTLEVCTSWIAHKIVFWHIRLFFERVNSIESNQLQNKLERTWRRRTLIERIIQASEQHPIPYHIAIMISKLPIHAGPTESINSLWRRHPFNTTMDLLDFVPNNYNYLIHTRGGRPKHHIVPLQPKHKFHSLYLSLELSAFLINHCLKLSTKKLGLSLLPI